MTARITFISHAPTEALRRASFPLDEPLEARDLARLQVLQWNVPRAQKILSAPEQRALQTARALQMEPLLDQGLRDCEYGLWKGKGLGELQVDDADGLVAWLTDPAAAPHGGESIKDLAGRVAGWLESQREADHIVAITHPAVIRSAVVHVLEAPLHAFWRIEIAHSSITDLRFNGRAWSIRSLACALERQQASAAMEDR